MLPTIEKLLVLQDRDRKILQLHADLGGLGPQRQALLAKVETAKANLEAGKLKVKHLESERKKLELDARAQRDQIEKYSLQQFQTKRNEEYRALAHEIETCKAAVSRIEDQELEFMEQIEAWQTTVLESTRVAGETQRDTDRQLAVLAEREQELRQQLAGLVQSRDQLAAGVDNGLVPRYERLRKTKGERVVVGVDHGVCGGCHVQLPPQTLVGCQANQEVMMCPNCGRILYYTRDMDLAVAD